jgi:hypothetical protein
MELCNTRRSRAFNNWNLCIGFDRFWASVELLGFYKQMIFSLPYLAIIIGSLSNAFVNATLATEYYYLPS